MTTRLLSLAAALTLAACGSGTLRPADQPEPVTPAPSVSPATTVDPEPAPATSPAPEPPPPSIAADTAPGPNPAPGTTVEIRRIGRWVSSGITGSRRLVIRDAGTWATFWSEMGAGVRPEVDFGADLVIAVAAGERNTGGHDIEVRNVSRAGNQLRIEVLETFPSTGCVTTQARTQPVDVVVVSAAGVKGWSFIDSRAVGTC